MALRTGMGQAGLALLLVTALALYLFRPRRLGRLLALVPLAFSLGLVGYAMGMTETDFFAPHGPVARILITKFQSDRDLARAFALRLGGRPGDSQRLFSGTLAQFRSIHDPRGEAAALIGLGDANAVLGHVETARRDYLAARRLLDQLGEARGEGYVLLRLGGMDLRHGRFDDAREAFREALYMYRAGGDARGLAVAMVRLGDVELTTGNSDVAQRYYLAAYRIAERRGDLLGEIDSLRGRGTWRLAVGDAAEAEALFRRALALFKGLKGPPDPDEENSPLFFRPFDGGTLRAGVLRGLGDAAAALHREDEARRAYDRALAEFRRVHDRHGEVATLRGLAALDKQATPPNAVSTSPAPEAAKG